MPNNSEKVMPINSESDTQTVNLEIIFRDFLVDILRGLLCSLGCWSSNNSESESGTRA
jgi:hypothetical protein